MKGFPKGDPRAVSAGRKGGRPRKQSTTKQVSDHRRGYQAGWAARNRATAAQMADAIVRRLFLHGAQRLVLAIDTPTPRNMGGWCRGAVVDQITDVLSGAIVAETIRTEGETR
jgi:hypothetical protein